METFNLKTTLTAYPKLSPSLLDNYVTKDDLNKELSENYLTKSEIADTYVPEVSDSTSDSVYARNGKDKKWVQLKEDTVAKEIKIYFGSNNQTQMDTVEEIMGLQHSDSVDKDTREYHLSYTQADPGILWICATQPITSIQWTQYLWGDYSKQTDNVVSGDDSYYCYRSNETLLDNLWEFIVKF